jgi:hypothetical protein
MIGMNDTPLSFRIKIGKKDNYHVMDPNGQEFPNDGNLFSYASMDGARPVNVIHGLNAGTGKKRVPSHLKDNSERIEVRFGDRKVVLTKGSRKTYLTAFDEAREAESIPDSWKIATVRADEGRIIIIGEDGVNPFWFREKLYPPLDETKDRLREAARKVPHGSWGKIPASPHPCKPVQQR